MSEQHSTFLASLASRYNLADSPNWQPLIQHFELGRGFAFIVLLVPNDDGAEVCRAALDAHLQESRKHVQQIPIALPDDLKQLAGTLLEMQPEAGAGAIWVARAVPEAVPHYQVWFEAWREGVARLNQFRNPLRRQFDIPLIFVGAPWLPQVLRNSAPDLWSVRTLVARVEPPLPTVDFDMLSTGTESGVPGRGPDPELALAEASRLRGKEGTELEVARLLYRAGLGFGARYQWPNAVKAFSDALELRRRVGVSAPDVADTLYQLGKARISTGEYGPAAVVLSQAKTEYEGAANWQGMANCLQALGTIALRQFDLSQAESRFGEALPLYRSAGDVLGEAASVASLGDTAVRRFAHDLARERYETALPLFRRVGNLRGEANCLAGLADIELRRSEYLTARTRYEEALVLYRRIGDVLGEANCISRLGDIALLYSDYATAGIRYEEALTLYRRIGDLRGEANSIADFGELEAAKRNPGAAREYYNDALRLFNRIGDPHAVGLVYRRLADISEGEEQQSFLAKARSAWESIGRQDLAAQLARDLSASTAAQTPPVISPR